MSRIVRIARILILTAVASLSWARADAQCTFNSLAASPNPVTVGSNIHFTWSPPTGAGCPAGFVGYRFYVQTPGAGSFGPPTNVSPPTGTSYDYTPSLTGSYAFKVDAAYTGNAACLTCAIAATQDSNIVNVTSQCTYSLSPTSNSLGSSGGTGTVGVTTQGGCGWTAVSNAGFITITGGASGSGNGMVSYSVAANTGAARSGTITAAGQTFTVNQSSGCTYSILPTSTSVGAAGGNGTTDVTAGTGCTWTAVSNATIITITGGSSGSGNGTVSFSVAA